MHTKRDDIRNIRLLFKKTISPSFFLFLFNKLSPSQLFIIDNHAIGRNNASPMFISIHNGSNQLHKTRIIIISHRPLPSRFISTDAIDGL